MNNIPVFLFAFANTTEKGVPLNDLITELEGIEQAFQKKKSRI